MRINFKDLNRNNSYRALGVAKAKHVCMLTSRCFSPLYIAGKLDCLRAPFNLMYWLGYNIFENEISSSGAPGSFIPATKSFISSVYQQFSHREISFHPNNYNGYLFTTYGSIQSSLNLSIILKAGLTIQPLHLRFFSVKRNISFSTYWIERSTLFDALYY